MSTKSIIFCVLLISLVLGNLRKTIPELKLDSAHIPTGTMFGPSRFQITNCKDCLWRIVMFLQEFKKKIIVLFDSYWRYSRKRIWLRLFWWYWVSCRVCGWGKWEILIFWVQFTNKLHHQHKMFKVFLLVNDMFDGVFEHTVEEENLR